MNIQCYFTYQSCPVEQYGEHTLVVIDVLRATSTIVTALDNGAKEFFCVKEIPAARALKAAQPDALLVGERSGDLIPGFDLSNSPFEFTPQVVAGKTIISCTTNGTAAIETAQKVRQLWVGAIVNCRAVAQRAVAEKLADLIVVCSGTEGRISLDDILGGGAIIHHINQLQSANQLNDAALIAEDLYLRYSANLEEGLHRAAHGRKLTRMGRGKDLGYCSREAIIHTVPEMADGKVILRS